MNRRMVFRLLRGLGLAATCGILTAGSCSEDVGKGDQFGIVTALISLNGLGLQANGGDSTRPSASADGRFVAFESAASDLVPTDSNTLRDVFIKNRNDGSVILASKNTVTGLQSFGDSGNPCMSGNGRYVVFESDGNLDSGTNDKRAVFRYDRILNVTRRVVGLQNLDQPATNPTISSDGRYVAFQTAAVDDTDAVAAMEITSASTYSNNGGTPKIQVFVSDMGTEAAPNNPPLVILISRTSGADNVGGDGDSVNPRISADGSTVVFATQATNLFSDSNGFQDIVAGTFTGVTPIGQPVTLISKVVGTGLQSNGDSDNPWPSDDGSFVCFSTGATNLGVLPAGGIIVRNVTADSLDVVYNVGFAGSPGAPSISGDATLVTFDSDDPAIPGNVSFFRQVIVANRQGTTLKVVSVHKSGALGNEVSRKPQFSGDGRWVVFESFASNLVAVDQNGQFDIFARGPLR